jgi:hypothetical protein
VAKSVIAVIRFITISPFRKASSDRLHSDKRSASSKHANYFNVRRANLLQL